jgi:16S rRNA (guanine527-N7)-methyltransferase
METHFRLLQKWNRKLNLTSLRDDREVIRRHFLESMQAAPFLEETGTLLDFGSGNGFPGVPLGLLRPGIRLLTLDSAVKKCSFLRELYRVLGWPVADVVHRRVDRRSDLEDLGRFRYITVRGVKMEAERIRGLLESLEGSGSLILFTGQGDLPFIRKSAGSEARLDTHPLAGRARTVVAVIHPPDVPRGTS